MFVFGKSRLAFVQSASVGTAAAIALTVGCGSPANSVSQQDAVTTSETSRNAVPATTVSATQVSPPLTEVVVGTWLGKAILDIDVLDQKLANLSEQQQIAIELQAESFLSTIMAMDFRADGWVESDVEITPLGEQPISERSAGQYRVTQLDGDSLLVEMSEPAADGSPNVTERTFRFYPDRNAFAISVPVSEGLQGCEAMMIFERQSAAVNVAQQPNAIQRK